jgi:hypothetical protein
MPMKNMDEIKKKYWKGTSEVNEEQALKKHSHAIEQGQPEDEYFGYLEQKRNEKLNDPDFERKVLHQIKGIQGVKKSLFQKINWQIAAAIVFLLSIGALILNRQMNSSKTFNTTNQIVVEDTFEDPRLAYEETKKALLLVSSKLNKGNAYATEFVKFSQSQENLKKNN